MKLKSQATGFIKYFIFPSRMFVRTWTQKEKLKVWNIKSACCGMGMFPGSFQIKMIFLNTPQAVETLKAKSEYSFFF